MSENIRDVTSVDLMHEFIYRTLLQVLCHLFIKLVSYFALWKTLFP